MTATKATTKESKFTLPNKIILVKPILRYSTINPKGHSGNWMYDGGQLDIVARLDSLTGRIVDPLTQEEREFFEKSEEAKELGLDFKPGDLSANKSKDNYWENMSVKIIKKAVGPISEDTVLHKFDLSDPHQYLQYAILRSNDASGGVVAQGLDNAYNRASNVIVLVEKDAEFNKTVEDIDKFEKVFKFFMSINNSVEEMINFMRIYNLTNKVSADVPNDVNSNWCKTEINNLITKNTDKVLKVIEDKLSYKDKTLIISALSHNLIKIGKGGAFFTMEGEFLGEDMEETIMFLNKPQNQELLLQIKAKLPKSK